MRLDKILHNISTENDYPANVEVCSIELNSQKSVPNSMFLALKGNKLDGKDFIDDAISKGATVIAYDGQYNILPQYSNIVFIKLQGNMSQNIAQIAHNFYYHSPKYISAVTGTNGKTSIADFTRQLMTNLGYSSASIGTIGVVCDAIDSFDTLTTPDSITMHQTLNKLAQKNVEYVSLEASSIGIEQYRLDGINISVAGFTNLTQDHLDYHHSMQEYLKAKEQLFSRVMQATGTAVLNADIKEFDELNDLCKKRGIKVLSYGYKAKDLIILSRTPHSKGQLLELEILGNKYKIELPLIGEFQAMNVLCAVGMVIALRGFEQKIMDYLPSIKGAIGRLEYMGSLSNNANIYVDYAHTPDALENVLNTMRSHTKGNLWVIFGCGGDRDKTKRPIMGKIANDLADMVIITDDNPRTENAEQIRLEVASTCSKAVNLGDRAKAIEYAVSRLKADDMLVIAGKGHEDYQIIGKEVVTQSDIKISKEMIKKYY